MKSPFPGMDPYLERYWGDVHTMLSAYTRDQLNPRLPGDLVARVEEYVSLVSPDDEVVGRLSPDTHATEYPSDGEPRESAGDAVAVADPVLIQVPATPRTKRRVLIHDSTSGNRVVTAIEFLCPANKVGEDGRAAYRRKRAEYLSAGVSVVEIDLLRDGGYVLYPPEELLPAKLRVPYRACAVRGWKSRTAEMYGMPLRERLPSIRVPLRRSDADVRLDIQALLDGAYENGRYDRTTDYKVEPEPRLAPEDAAWADKLLKAAGKR